MRQLQRVINREVRAKREYRVGTVLTDPRITDFDGNGSGVWVVDVEVGDNNFLKNVPVKASGSGRRFYAQCGQTVLVRRNAGGRFDVTGPGDRAANPVVEKSYDLAALTEISSVNIGFTSERVAFSYYATLDGTAPLGVLWADGTTEFNLVRTLDADGNPV